MTSYPPTKLFSRNPAAIRRKRSAFTLIEVLITVAILGLVSLAVVPSILTAGELGVQAAARVIVADLLYAQNEAIAQQAGHRVVFNIEENAYEVRDQNGQVLTVDWIDGQANNFVVDFDEDVRFQGVTITDANFGGTTPREVSFDSLGGPSSGGSITIEFDRQRFRIDVAEFTGRITVTQL